MIIQKFSKSEAIRFGWNVMKNNLGFFIGFLIVAGLIYCVPSIIVKLLPKDVFILSIIINIVSLVLQLIIGMGLIRVAIRFCDNEKGEFADLFYCFPLFFKYLFSSILYGLIVLGGLILLIVPGIIWGIKFQFFAYFIVDKGCGPMEALKRSSAITMGAKWNLFLFSLLLGLINLVGTLCLLIGLFVTIPVTMVARAFIYRKLLAQTEIVQMSETSSKEINK